MAVTVTTLLHLVDSADTETGWSGNSGEQDLEVYIQGSGTPASYTWQSGKNSIKTADFTHATGVDASSYTYPHLYFWMRDDVFPFSEDKTTGTTNNSGLMVEITLSNNATKKWHIAGANSWRGEWKNFMLDLSNTSDLYSSSGTWDLSANNIDTIEWQVDLSNSGVIRIIDNTWQDVLRVGEGLKATGTAFDMLDISSIDSSLANMYGILQSQNGVLFMQGKLQVGDGATTTTFNSEGEQVIFIDPSSAGLGGASVGSLNPNLYEIKATGSGCDFSVKSSVIVGSGLATFKLDLGDSALNSLTFIGNTITNANAIIMLSDASKTEVTGNSFNSATSISIGACIFNNNVINNSGNITASSANFNYNTINNSTATSAVTLADLAYTIKNTYNSSGTGHAVELTALGSGTMSWDNQESGYASTDGSTGNETIYVNVSSGTLTINVVSGASTPTIRTAGANITVVSGSYDFTFIVNPSITGYEYRIYTVTAIGSLAGASEVQGIETATQDSYTYNYVYTSDQPIAVQIIAQPNHDYEEKIEYYTLIEADQNQTINLLNDINN